MGGSGVEADHLHLALQTLLAQGGGRSLRREQIGAKDSGQIRVGLQSSRRYLGGDVGVVLAILLTQILDVREFFRDGVAETLFSLIGGRDAWLDVDNEDFAFAADGVGKTSRRQATAFYVIGRNVTQLDIGFNRGIDAKHW